MLSDGNPLEWFQRWRDWATKIVTDFRDAWSIADPYRFGTKYQTVVIPHLGAINRNNRIYTHETAVRMCGQFDPNTVGELGHPDGAIVSLTNASHRIRRVFISGNSLWAEYSVLDTPAGRLLYELFQQIGPETFVLSPRGVGSVKAYHLQEDHKVITYDFIPLSESAFRPFTEEEILQEWKEIFRNDPLLLSRWYDSPMEEFDGETPRSLVESDKGAIVMTYLKQFQLDTYI